MARQTNAIPANLDAERWFLSCCAMDGPQMVSNGIAAGIVADSFSDIRTRTIWNAMVALVRDGHPTSAEIVADYLIRHNQLEDAGGIPHVSECTKFVGSTAHGAYWIGSVMEAHRLRQLASATYRIQGDVTEYDGGGVDIVVDEAAREIIGIAAQRPGENWKDSVAGAVELIAKRTDPNRANEPDEGISFGFDDVDSTFGKMQPGQLVIIAARPSVGKSSLARLIAWHAVKSGRQVVFASLEVTGRQLAINFAQTISGVSARTLNRACNADVQDFNAALKKLATPSLDILASTSVTISGIVSRLEVMRARGTPCKLLVIDYLGIMPDTQPGKGETRSMSVGRVSRALKSICLRENIVCLLLSQLNRDSAKDGREPAMHDLRDSGDIEQDADKIIFIHRPADDPETGVPQPENSLASDVPSFYVNLIQAKGRDDGTGFKPMRFVREATRFLAIQKQ